MSEQQEPFGYFKCEPFGWVDCPETDEGAIPLYDLDAVQKLEQQRDELLAALKGLVHDIDGLIANSNGVAGLHLNGHVATWEELFDGWLSELSTAHVAIAKAEANK